MVDLLEIPINEKKEIGSENGTDLPVINDSAPIQLPSIEQMEALVQQRSDPKPPPTLPSDNRVQLYDQQQVKLPTTHVQTPLLHQLYLQLFRPLKLLLALGLGVQAMIGVFKSLKFLTVTYPLLEAQLTTHHVSSDQVNTIATKAILSLVTTILGMILALHLVRAKALKLFNVGLGLLLFFGGGYLTSFLSQNIDAVGLLTDPILTLFYPNR